MLRRSTRLHGTRTLPYSTVQYQRHRTWYLCWFLVVVYRHDALTLHSLSSFIGSQHSRMYCSKFIPKEIFPLQARRRHACAGSVVGWYHGTMYLLVRTVQRLLPIAATNSDQRPASDMTPTLLLNCKTILYGAILFLSGGSSN